MRTKVSFFLDHHPTPPAFLPEARLAFRVRCDAIITTELIVDARESWAGIELSLVVKDRLILSADIGFVCESAFLPLAFSGAFEVVKLEDFTA